MRFTLMGIDDIESVQIIDAINADSKTDKKNHGGKFLHFRAQQLVCNATYQYEILYKGEALTINNLNTHSSNSHVIIRTPPARQDPRPIKIAVGGDQEQHEQYGFLGTLFDLDNHRHTESLYQHIGREGSPDASALDNIEEQPYQLFIHLGDLY